MGNDVWYDHFLESILARYPKKARLADDLMELLNIEREAVYRRLRKDVLFSPYEIVKMASAWHISLDEITKIDTGTVTFTMRPINYFNPSDEEFVEIQRKVKRLELMTKDPNSEFMSICNILPRSLTTGFPLLYQFDIFRWVYQYGNEDVVPPFGETTISKKFFQEMSDYSQLMKRIANTYYIWDDQFLEHLIREILYFHSILLITDEEKESLKKELFVLLDYLQEVASKGYFPETKKKVTIYISKMNIRTNYSYFYTEPIKVCRIHAFDKHDIGSFDIKMVEGFRTWMQLKKRTAIQISEVDEKSRIDFFMKQRELVEKM